MYIKPFGVERWLSLYETNVKYNLTSTSIIPFSLNELIDVTSIDKKQVEEDIFSLRLSYGSIKGVPDYLTGVASLYDRITPEQVISTHGGVGASHLTMMTLIEPQDHVVAILPAYQQIYSVPESIGAQVDYLFLQKDGNTDYLIDLDHLNTMVTPKTKAICLNNPNNPTGDVISDEILKKIVEIARKNDAYLICDEAYRGLEHREGFSLSVADAYEKGVSLGSMSKAFAMAGLRLGWIATQDKWLIETVEIHRDYTMISCGGLDEYIAGLALKHKQVICQRNLSIVRHRVTLFKEWIDQEAKLSCVLPKGGTVALPYYESQLSSKEFCRQVAEQKSVLLMPGSVFELENCFRMGCAREPEETFIKGLEQVSDFLKQLDK
ncbi:aminotransferase class I/II-fold pyridoxal phosphate-dependent enzyme [Enterococcus sp. LJL99]